MGIGAAPPPILQVFGDLRLLLTTGSGLDIFAELSKSTGEIHVWLIWICINI